MKSLLREPLVQFLCLGAILFTAYHFVIQPQQDEGPDSKQIRLSSGELAQLAMLFQAQWRRDPTPEELGKLVENRVQEEVLYREALDLGLDQDDTIVKRRMAQKMQFLAEDAGAAQEPTTEQLRSWFSENYELFAQPPRVSFRHLYFSPDLRGANAQDDAAAALAQLASQPENAGIADAIADPFMFQGFYGERSPDEVAKEFGPGFAEAVFQLSPGAWQGPVESGYGWHLVYVDVAIPRRVPVFEEVEADVKTAWFAEQKAEAWHKAYAAMRAKYTLILPSPEDSSPADSQSGPPAADVPPL